MVLTDLDTGVYMRPEVGGKILIGTVEPACDAQSHEYLDDPEEAYPGRSRAGLTEQWTNQVYRSALRMPALPLPDATSTQGVVACYDVTEDWTPIYDKSALPGYYMAIGTSGNQFKNAGVADAGTELVGPPRAATTLTRLPSSGCGAGRAHH